MTQFYPANNGVMGLDPKLQSRYRGLDPKLLEQAELERSPWYRKNQGEKQSDPPKTES